ncbi:GW dipeptide domain-containing protein [Bacillus sp. FSL K6-3431]|uniref:GW dipeptide domain-containing protein n=1 Tax=Bacillus sp. FSL K6-3431 TaxID=2921500 RepID=UPI0030FB2CE6
MLKGKQVWIHSSYVMNKKDATTSKLGHINNAGVKIYSSLEGTSTVKNAGETYTNRVYYIKKQDELKGVIYYLISQNPSSIKGVVGWVKATDVFTHAHSGVDKNVKTFYVKGTGRAYIKAWGGSQDVIYTSLTAYKHQEFKVHLTEKVGNNIWYRGILNGKTVWIHSDYITDILESNTSKLGHIRNSEVKIYPSLNVNSTVENAGALFTNYVYYIKKQASKNKQLYYLISNEPSSSKGIVGWVKANDLSIHTHLGVDKKTKSYYLKGTGSATSKAWGGSKDIVYQSLTPYKRQEFKVHLTEKVGNNIWYRGSLKGKTVWIHHSNLINR